MATYAFGDIQGCWRTFQRLLDRVGPAADDRVWLAGDLVNRGRGSLDVLRWASRQNGQVTAVLGNHDLHLLGCAAGTRRVKSRDTFEDVLEARDRDDLLDWLAARPLLVRAPGDAKGARAPLVMVHAGLLPQWTVPQAEGLATEAADALRADRQAFLELLADGDAPRTWRDGLAEGDRLRCVVSGLTRIRCCTPDGAMDPDYSGPPAEAPDSLRPWFAMPKRKSADATITFGHWAALGLILDDGVIALDTGCVWGNRLTAVRLEDRAVFQEPTHPKDIAR